MGEYYKSRDALLGRWRQEFYEGLAVYFLTRTKYCSRRHSFMDVVSLLVTSYIYIFKSRHLRNYFCSLVLRLHIVIPVHCPEDRRVSATSSQTAACCVQHRE